MVYKFSSSRCKTCVWNSRCLIKKSMLRDLAGVNQNMRALVDHRTDSELTQMCKKTFKENE